jgi:hypothetical protein
MARGMSCPECGSAMYAQEEREEAEGVVVTYVCRDGACASVQRGFPAMERVFEGV